MIMPDYPPAGEYETPEEYNARLQKLAEQETAERVRKEQEQADQDNNG
jgi:hypothetical protein